MKEHVAVVAEHHHVGRLDRELRADAGLRHRDDVVDVLDVRRPAGLAAEVARLEDVGDHGDVEPRAAHLRALGELADQAVADAEHDDWRRRPPEPGADARRRVQAEHVGKLTHRLRGVLLHADQRVDHRPASAGDQHAEPVDLRRRLLVERRSPRSMPSSRMRSGARRWRLAAISATHDAPQRSDRRRQVVRRLGLDDRGRRRQRPAGRRLGATDRRAVACATALASGIRRSTLRHGRAPPCRRSPSPSAAR